VGIIRKISGNKEELTAQEFERAFEMYYSSIRNYVYFKTSQSELAEDMAQEAFVKLWETRHRIDKTSIKAYLYTIAGNLTINQLKRDQLKYKFMNLQVRGKDINNPQYILEMQEFDAKLQHTLSKIPEGAREVFLMNRIEDLKYHEIAERLNLSVKAVEKRMSRALAIIREELQRNL